jgi:insertion element IS1 protein InsB
MKCQYCKGSCIKKGCYKRRQLYRCSSCGKYQRSTYLKKRISETQIDLVGIWNNEGAGVSSISRVLKMSKSSVLRKLIFIEQQTEKPNIDETNQEYEIDEMRTYIGSTENECWIMYALNKVTRDVIDFAIGRRTKENIKKVVDAVLVLNPKRIFTDGWNVYPGLIPKEKHIRSAHRINHIERKNLDLRTHLKCLNRKTIWFSKSEEMLATKLQIYFFGLANSVS